jgi:hypothetical protein
MIASYWSRDSLASKKCNDNDYRYNPQEMLKQSKSLNAHLGGGFIKSIFRNVVTRNYSCLGKSLAS